ATGPRRSAPGSATPQARRSPDRIRRCGGKYRAHDRPASPGWRRPSQTGPGGGHTGSRFQDKQPGSYVPRKSLLPAAQPSGRPSGRTPDQLRLVTLETGVNRYAEGSCLVTFGHTKVLVTASVEEKVPGWMRNTGQGWVTAEYGMLPRATHTRGRREAAAGKQSGRTQEIQRLIGRSLRAVVDLKALGERQVSLDCDVIQADGGTRTAAITGAWVAMASAFD